METTQETVLEVKLIAIQHNIQIFAHIETDLPRVLLLQIDTLDMV